MSDELKRLLEAEDAVQKTIAELERLQQAAGHYSAARGTMQETGKELGVLIAECRAVAAATVEGVRVLRELSMPRVLEEIAAIRAQIDASRGAAETRLSALDEHLRGTSIKLAESLRQTAADSAAALAGRAEETLRHLGAETTASVADVGASLGERLTTGLEALSTVSAEHNRLAAQAITDLQRRAEESSGQLRAEARQGAETLGAELAGRLGSGLTELRELLQGVAEQVQGRLKDALAEHVQMQSAAFGTFASRLQAAIDGIEARTPAAVADAVGATVAEFKRELAKEGQARQAARADVAGLSGRVEALEAAHDRVQAEAARLRWTVLALATIAVVMPLAVLVVMYL